MNFIQYIVTEHAIKNLFVRNVEVELLLPYYIFCSALGHLSRESIETSGWSIRYGGLFGRQQGRPNHCRGWHTETWEKT